MFNTLDTIVVTDALSDPEIEEMEAVMAGVPDEDWNAYLSDAWVDPAEQACCPDWVTAARRLCGCGGS